QRQNRNLGEIDLLLAGKREQQVKRALEALDVDQQRRLVVAAICEFGFECLGFAHQTVPDIIMAVNSRRAAARSIAAGDFRTAKAAAARRKASTTSYGLSGPHTRLYSSV